MNDSARRPLLTPRGLVLAAALVTIIAYAPAIGGSFLFDDLPLLQGYECWRGLDRVPAMLGLGEPNPCTYRPLRYVTFALDYTVGGLFGDPMQPAIYHLSNLLWHLLALWAVFALLRRWTGVWTAALLAALWCLHPVQTDAVAYISGRRDLVSTLFYLLAALQLMPRAGGGGLTRRPLRLALGTACFALAFLAKEMAVTLPAVLLVGAVVAGSGAPGSLRRHFRRRWPMYAALLAVASGFVVWRGVLASHSFMHGAWWGGSPTSNFATVFALYARYLQLLVWPAPLIGDYFPVTIPLAADFSDPRALLGIGLYAGLVVLAVVAWRRGWKATAFGVGWFLVTMLPVSHILPHHELFAEHYLYLPTVGLAIALAPAVERAFARSGWARIGVAGLAAAVAVAMAVRTGARAGEYRSEQAFYEAAVAHAPDNARASHYLGVLYVEQGRCAEAMPLLERAARIIPADSRLGRDGLAARLLCAERLGRDEQVPLLVDALLAAHPDDPFGLAERARQREVEGRLDEAVADLERAVEAGGGADAEVISMLARLDNQLGRHADALAVLGAHPHEGEGLCEQRVLALLGLGVSRYPEAFSVVQSCLTRYPESWRLLELRAGLYLAQGRPDAAEADVARMRALGAPEEAIERVRRLRP